MGRLADAIVWRMFSNVRRSRVAEPPEGVTTSVVADCPPMEVGSLTMRLIDE